MPLAEAKKPIEKNRRSSPSPLLSSTGRDSQNDTTKVPIRTGKRKAESVDGTMKRAREATISKPKTEMVHSTATASLPTLTKRAVKTGVPNNEVDENGTSEKLGQVAKTTISQTSTRRSKTVKRAELLQERTKDTRLRVGAHVSIAGGIYNALANIVSLGGNAFALFLKNQRRWESPDLSPEHVRLFLEDCREHNIDAAACCVPHGSYLVNLAHPDPDRKSQAYGSFLDDLIRCNKLGIKLYNIHPGNANACSREEGIQLIAESINRAHEDPDTGSVITLLGTMAFSGNTIGGTFTDIGAIIALVKDKSRVGACLDTCHIFAAGYDLRTPQTYAAVMEQFDHEVGFKYLKAFHINDSKAPLGSHRDLHARIGTGYLGLHAFHNIMNDQRFQGLPMILETPASIPDKDGKKTEDKGLWAREIKMLENLVGMDVEADEFRELEKELQEEGRRDRDRIDNQIQNSKAKKRKARAAGLEVSQG